ncbi:Ureidoglycolate lyase [Xylophilus ampelinus]|uniref:2-hydroxyhepta-2,4-diene-1,7-dioate isomerase n=1 Tax=Variovorax paradoxus TaxID=34073 RepID=A0A2W5SFV3_VARPD|nr:MAG: 2-hydroxyhepta-2,4-diene-1,7-dioate isomerase [Variovorax paradoxus]VTY39064.1 Ureidoglycolate lyase [Xylophilus ampelinus]
MKLFRHGPSGSERAGMLDREGGRRDLSAVVPDVTAAWLEACGLDAIRSVDPQSLPRVARDARIGCPIAGVRQLIAVGLNYREHAAEAGLPIPTEPIIFNKAITCLNGPDDDVVLPHGSMASDWEIEVAIVIGQVARRVSVESAMSYVAGFSLANDVSERDWQLKRNGQWGKGKSFDTFGPLGPWLVTPDEINAGDIPLTLSVNSQIKQSSNTRDMIFDAAYIVSYISSFQTLLPGDVIMTGTPQGVGLGMKPPQYLRAGDRMELDGGPLGTQTQLVVSTPL